jgi:hypothetical protein
MNIYHKPIHHVHCLHKKIWSQNSIGWSVGLKNLTDSFKCLWILFRIPHPVTNVCDNFFEIFSNFFHSLYLWYHAFTTNFIIFGLHLCFIEFKIYSATNSLLCFLNKIFDFFSLNSCTNPQIWLNNMNIIFPLIINTFDNIWQFKFELYTKYSCNQINNLNIVNIKDNLPNLNMMSFT